MDDESHRNVINAVDDFLEKLNKSHLRKIELSMHLCAANCCKDTSTNKESFQKCVINCAQSMQKVKTKIESDMNNVQNRLTLCIQRCHDKVRDSLGSNPPECELTNHKKDMKRCVAKCANETVTLLPNTLKQCQEWIDCNVK